MKSSEMEIITISSGAFRGKTGRLISIRDARCKIKYKNCFLIIPESQITRGGDPK